MVAFLFLLALGSMTDADDRCTIASPGSHPSPGGVTSLWPLHDTTCGPELVPAFTNPLVIASAALCLALVAASSYRRWRHD
ncbi:hypothetical protein ACQPZX_40795 [Actinoplanes sp. CA-142083]|uniref:hypothetical protein n=1 Tax=Actinoplanes sp. CA-142083 TaxID=3239903 RepID=UPI003D933800